MSGKHIVFIGNTAWSMFNFRRLVLFTLVKKGYKVTVISPHDPVFQEKIKELGCSYFPIPVDSKGVNPFKDFRLLCALVKCFRQIRPDFCFSYTVKPNVYGSIAARITGVPLIPVVTGLGYAFLSKGIIWQLVKYLYTFAFRYPRQIWFLNENDQDFFTGSQIVSPAKTFLLKGEGVDLSHFMPQPEKSKDTSFLLVARMLKDKGILEFAEAAGALKNRYPAVRFQLLGFVGVDNPNAIHREQIAAWQEEKIIEYVGSTNDVRPFIADATCVVLPSYREGIPCSLLEAAAMGKPLVTTRAVGCIDTVDDGITGFLCEPKDAKSLQEAMEKIIRMSGEDRRKMGEAGRRKMEAEYDVKKVIGIYLKIVDEL